MDWKLIHHFIANGQAFIPVNIKDKGDSLQLFFKDGTTKVLDVRCDTFLKRLLVFFGTSVAANRNRYGELVGKKQLVPVVLSYGFTLIPYHVRDAIGRQTRDGWILAKEITDLQGISSGKTRIRLTDHEIVVLHSKRFCLDQLKNARWIEHCYGEIHEPHRKNWPISNAVISF